MSHHVGGSLGGVLARYSLQNLECHVSSLKKIVPSRDPLIFYECVYDSVFKDRGSLLFRAPLLSGVAESTSASRFRQEPFEACVVFFDAPPRRLFGQGPRILGFVSGLVKNSFLTLDTFFWRVSCRSHARLFALIRHRVIHRVMGERFGPDH